MLQSERVEINFPSQPTLIELALVLSVSVLVGFALIVIGTLVLNRSGKRVFRFPAIVALSIGFFLCLITGSNFLFNRHNRIDWTSGNHNFNYWIDIIACLFIWGASIALFHTVRKFGSRNNRKPETNAN